MIVLYYKQLFKFSAQNKVENILNSFCTVIIDMSISTASFINCIYCLNVSSVHSTFYSAQLQIYSGSKNRPDITSLSV